MLQYVEQLLNTNEKKQTIGSENCLKPNANG